MKNFIPKWWAEKLRAHLRRLLDVPSRGSVNLGDQATLELIESQSRMLNGQYRALTGRITSLEDRVRSLQSTEQHVGGMATAVTIAVGDIVAEVEKFKELVKLASDGVTLRGIAEELVADETEEVDDEEYQGGGNS